MIVNYDTPWNATKLIQRIGRVNRIGAKADKIHVYNFFPTSNVEDDISLEQKAFLKLQSFHEALGEDSQIFNDAEETQSFGLFDKDIEEEKDEKLSLLMELRKFKVENESYFRKLKAKSKRQRVGRKNKHQSKETICFIRNDKRNAFYYVDKDKNISEKTFIEAAKIFSASVEEVGIELSSNHHEHVKDSIFKFDKEQQEENINNQSVSSGLTPQAGTAISLLDACLKFDFLNDDEKKLIDSAKNSIKIQQYINLQREINRLAKSLKTLELFEKTQIIDLLLKILKKYPLNTKQQQKEYISINPNENFSPEIIISESFKI